MTNIRLSRGLCAAVGNSLRGSHLSLDALFQSSGVPGEPPNLSHASKWKEWLFRAGTDPDVDSLSVLGNVIEELMDIAPQDLGGYDDWKARRDNVAAALEEDGLRYYRGGRVLPIDQGPDIYCPRSSSTKWTSPTSAKLSDIGQLLEILFKGLRRAMHPLTHRRKGAQTLIFSSEYDVQDLLHALLRPWVADIRPEEFTPSYAGSSTRMDFLLPRYKLVIEIKFVRDRAHAKKIGDELIVDVEHYRRHPDCSELWCVVYDQDHLLQNAEGLKSDLEGTRAAKDGEINVKIFVP
jgi:hypothetical protein